MQTVRGKITYANVTATLALFIALGGTGYAVARNSVGSTQLRKGAVGKSDLAKGAVTTRSINNGSVRRGDLSKGTVRSFGRPLFTAAVSSSGGLVRGNAVAGGSAPGDGVFTIRWRRDVSKCAGSATLASVPGGPVTDPPPGTVTLHYVGPGVEVRTFDAAGTQTDLPFTIVLAC